MIGLIIGFVALTLVAAIFHAISYRKNDDMNPKAMLLSLAAAILAAIGFFSTGGGDSVSGAYTYYVNGVRMGSGVMSVGTTLLLSFMACVVSHFISVGIGYLFGHQREAREKGKPRVWLLVASIIAILSSSGFIKFLLMTPELSLADRLLIIGLLIVTWGLSIWGIVDYIIKKKKQRARYGG